MPCTEVGMDVTSLGGGQQLSVPLLPLLGGKIRCLAEGRVAFQKSMELEINVQELNIYRYSIQKKKKKLQFWNLSIFRRSVFGLILGSEYRELDCTFVKNFPLFGNFIDL